ncbi:MAG: ATP-binding protein, partial [Thermoplasmatales archaeon]
MKTSEDYIDTISLQVAAQIIKHISAGLYRSPGSSIKELLSNSFDADASNVDVTFHFSYPKGSLYLDKITVRDNGLGMSIKDLYYIFTHIGGSEKNNPKGAQITTKKHRKIIGRMGIGMLSVASACRGFVVRTKKREETREYVARISLAFFDDTIQRTESMDKTKLGNVELSSRHVGGYDSYTEIEISDFKPPFLESIVPTISSSFIWVNKRGETSDEDYFEAFIDYIQSTGKLGKLALIDRLIIDIGCMSPVEYHPDGPVRRKVVIDGVEFHIPGTEDKGYLEIVKKSREVDFSVRIKLMVSVRKDTEMEHNSFKLFKPFLYPNLGLVKKFGFKDISPYVYVLPVRNDQILNDDGEYENLVVNGYYYHQSKRIEPVEYSGLLFRVFNVALGNEFGDPMKFFVDTYMIQQQSLVEVYLDDGFQQIVNLDREGLFEGSNVYRYLKNYLVHYIRGEAPPRPTETITEDKKAIVEEQFRKEQEKLFPVNKDGSIVSKIKKRRTQYREKIITDRTESLKQRILDRYNVEDLKIKKVQSLSETGLFRE